MKETLLGWLKKYLRRISSSYWEECEYSYGTKIKLYTNEYCYTIVAQEHQNMHSYLGCTSTQRKTKPGEDHFRGCDLSDGKFSEETFLKIMGDIIANELLFVGRPTKNNEKQYDVKFETEPITPVCINEASPMWEGHMEIGQIESYLKVDINDVKTYPNQTMSDFEILVKILRFTPEEAKSHLENIKKNKEELAGD